MVFLRSRNGKFFCQIKMIVLKTMCRSCNLYIHNFCGKKLLKWLGISKVIWNMDIWDFYVFENYLHINFCRDFFESSQNTKNMLYRLSERYPLPRCMLPYNLSQKILVQQTFSYIYTNSFMIKICTFLGFFIINYGMFSLSKKSFRIYRILKQKIISRIFFVWLCHILSGKSATQRAWNSWAYHIHCVVHCYSNKKIM